MEFEEVTLPVTVERPLGAKDTQAQLELEETYKALTRKEIENRIQAHLASTWERPIRGERGTNALEAARRRLAEHFRKHGSELGFASEKEYSQAVYDIIRNPERVYVEKKLKKGKEEVNYIFVKGYKVVVSNDNQDFYKLREDALRDKTLKRS